MDRQLFIDRLLESENLTDNLEDEAANTLIKWGIAQIDHLTKSIEEEEAAGEKVNHLMGLMRGVNSVAGNPSAASPDALLRLLDRYAQTFDKEHCIDEDERKAMAQKLSTMQPKEAVQYLLDWIDSKR
ncbi:MAG TPA: hypothetical protein VK249_21030 [Anaerolineales bacterium]|nr:hypothetical protein [Anaerolineales bacterium]